MLLVLVLHILDAAARSEHDVCAPERLLVPFRLKHLERRKLLREEGAGFSLQGRQRYARFDTADDVSPLDFQWIERYRVLRERRTGRCSRAAWRQIGRASCR